MNNPESIDPQPPHINSANPYQLGDADENLAMSPGGRRPVRLDQTAFELPLESDNREDVVLHPHRAHLTPPLGLLMKPADQREGPASPAVRDPATGAMTTGWRKRQRGSSNEHVQAGPSTRRKGKERARDDEYKSNQPSDDDTSSEDVPHVVGGAGEVLAAEAEARRNLPPPPRQRNYGRVTENIFQLPRGVRASIHNVFPDERIDLWGPYTLYNAFADMNRLGFQEANGSSMRPYIFPAAVAFKSQRQFVERQAHFQKGIDEYTEMLKSKSWKNKHPNLQQSQVQRILDTLSAVKDEEASEKEDQVIATLDELLMWINSLKLMTKGNPIYFVCYARDKMLWEGSIGQRMLADPGVVGPDRMYPTKAHRDREMYLRSEEFKYGAAATHAGAIRVRFDPGNQHFDFQIFDSNFKSDAWAHAFPTREVQKLSLIPFNGGLVKQAIESIRHFRRSSGDPRKSPNTTYSIVRNGGGNRATQRAPTGICSQLAALWILQCAANNLNFPRAVDRWNNNHTQIIKYLG